MDPNQATDWVSAEMSSYTLRFYDYLEILYSALVQLTILAVIMVLGWYVLEKIFEHDRLRSLYEKLYLVACGSIYVFLVAIFWGMK